MVSKRNRILQTESTRIQVVTMSVKCRFLAKKYVFQKKMKFM